MIKKKNALSYKQTLAPFMCCVGGIMLNLLLGMAVSQLKLPLYLDTVGTVTVAVIGGYLPGVLVVFVTNIIKAYLTRLRCITAF